MKRFGIVALVIASAVLLAALVRGPISRRIQDQTESPSSGFTPESKELQTVINKVSIPWGMVQLPGLHDLLITERSGTLIRIGTDNVEHTISGVEHIGEGGLLGVALHPQFQSNRFIYLYLTTQSSGGLSNRVERYVFQNNQLTNRQVIIQNIPGAATHDGGQIAFGPDGFLYVATGDANDEQSAQDRNSLAGKILRVTTDGEAAPGNPFNNRVYSYGHRNPQGLAWDDKKQLWSSERGPSGSQTGNDEINLIIPGGNYGWPIIKGSQTRAGMRAPVLESGKDDTWAPASLAYHDGALYFGGLRSETLFRATIAADNSLKLKRLLELKVGRIRSVLVGKDNWLYLSTSNTDGRGSARPNDDHVFKIKADQL